MTRSRRLTYTAVFSALGVIIPVIFHATDISGQMFLPMHIPVLLCGMICGPFFGAVCGVIAVILSSSLTGMPVLYPMGMLMAFELTAYAAVSGLLMKIIKIKPFILKLYIVLIAAMLAGRGVYGLAAYVTYGIFGGGYAFSVFISSTFVKALPGILIQLALIPSLILCLKKARLLDCSEAPALNN